MSVDNSARTALWYLSFFGFAINCTIRVNLNIALVAMVQPRPVEEQFTSPESECVTRELSNATLRNNETIVWATQYTFPWDEKEQNMVLGSYYWLHWTTPLAGGVLAQIYGGKKVFGLMTLLSTLLCFLIPPAAHYNFYALLAVRLIQGFIGGFIWPAMHTLAGLWIPPNERSTFTSSYTGYSVGAAVMYPLCGLIIDWLGWEYVFHVTGILGVVWYIAWYILAFDSPSVHPRISQEEKNYILTSLNQTSKQEKLPTPWRSILLSLPLWIMIFCLWGGTWGVQTLLIQLPTYLLHIHGWNVKATGLLSGIPNVAPILTGYLSSVLADYLLRNNKLSRNHVRKLFTAIYLLGQALFFVGVVLSGCDSVAVMVMITLASACQGTVLPGLIVALVDIAPNFAGILFGLSTMITSTVGFLSTALVGALTYNNQTTEQWMKIILITAGMAAFPCFIFIAFVKIEVQKWNCPKKEEQSEILEPLKEKSIPMNGETV